MESFAFEMGQRVKISVSLEEGTITGRAEYSEHPRSYLVEYKAADGRASEGWFGESKLQAV